MSEKIDYLLVGDGKLACHLEHYFSLLGLNFDTWARRTDTRKNFNQKAQKANYILLSISDQSIEPFANEYLKEYLRLFSLFRGLASEISFRRKSKHTQSLCI